MTDKDWLSLISEQNTAKFLFNGYESTYIYIIILIFCHHVDSLWLFILNKHARRPILNPPTRMKVLVLLLIVCTIVVYAGMLLTKSEPEWLTKYGNDR
jgi:hypothetical protein